MGSFHGKGPISLLWDKFRTLFGGSSIGNRQKRGSLNFVGCLGFGDFMPSETVTTRLLWSHGVEIWCLVQISDFEIVKIVDFGDKIG